MHKYNIESTAHAVSVLASMHGCQCSLNEQNNNFRTPYEPLVRRTPSVCSALSIKWIKAQAFHSKLLQKIIASQKNQHITSQLLPDPEIP